MTDVRHRVVLPQVSIGAVAVHRVAGLLFFGFIAFVATGFFEAFSLKKVDGSERASLITPGWINYDTYDLVKPFDPDQLFLRVTWANPTGATVREITVEGEVSKDGKSVESFKEPCTRRGSKTLPTGTEEPTIADAFVCYAKLKTLLEPRTPEDLASHPFSDPRMNSVSFKFWTTTRGSTKPRRYVTWTINAFNNTIESIKYPFERE
ncbi:hypothetical protein GR215_23130 [Rhizobium leguminosarum]|uniref:hypothetical protein n=1 Tax=Rhizobium leguminosarum TaxID=384 RepID=UPI0013B74B2D|nr:hypothetical protein [Rhizobium leguminosarum]NEH44743.1 hypothetical protein [Rhizobium leguminosarum]